VGANWLTTAYDPFEQEMKVLKAIDSIRESGDFVAMYAQGLFERLRQDGLLLSEQNPQLQAEKWMPSEIFSFAVVLRSNPNELRYFRIQPMRKKRGQDGRMVERDMFSPGGHDHVEAVLKGPWRIATLEEHKAFLVSEQRKRDQQKHGKLPSHGRTRAAQPEV